MATVFTGLATEKYLPTLTPEPTELAPIPAMVTTSQVILPEGALLRQGIGLIFSSALNQERTRLALGTATGIYVYSVPDLFLLWRSGADFPVTAVRWSPDELRLLTSYDTYAPPALWGSDGRLIRQLDGFLTPEWSPGGTMIAVPYQDLSQPEGQQADRTGIRLYDGKTGDFLRDLKASQEYSFDTTGYDIKWSPDEVQVSIQAGGWSDIRHTWDALAGKLISSAPSGNRFGDDPELDNGGYSPDYNLTATRDYTHHTIIIDARGTILARFPTQLPALEGANLPQAYWLPDKRLLVIEDSAVSLITTSGHIERSFGTGLPWVAAARWASPDRIEFFQTCSLYPYDSCPVNKFALDIASNTLAPQGMVLPADLPSHELFTDYTKPGADASHLAPQSGSSVTVTSSSSVLTVKRADGSTYAIDTSSLPHGSTYRQFGWSPDGESLLLIAESAWDIDSPFVPSPGVGGGMLAVWNVQSEKMTAFSKFDPGATTAAWSPDSRTVAVGLASTDMDHEGGVEDSRIVLFDAATGVQLMELKGHTGGASTLAWSPDGTRLASTSDDGTVIIWDTSKLANR